MIKVTKLGKYFDRLEVLNNINLFIERGSIVSIIGPSGSGKTTLLRCIIGLNKETEGEVKINGLKREKYLISNRIAFVSQRYSNFPWLTVKQNIELGFKYNLKDELDIDLEIEKLLQELSLVGFGDYYISQLSGGMQQRVAIARALAQDTEILAMDEPFGALDLKTRESLQLLIKNINKEHNKTILFVTHDIEEAIFLSDMILPLSKMPSTIIKEYKSPFKKSNTQNVKYQEEFVKMRMELENEFV